MTCKAIWFLAAVGAALAIGEAGASETGGGVYPNGAEGFLGGALPPPGWYGLVYLNHYQADRFNDGDGDAGFLPDFEVRADALVARTVYVSERRPFGASWAMHLIVPLVDLEVDAAGQSGHRRGVSDLTFNPFILGWHFDNGWHLTTGLDINVPVGSYDRRSPANFSRHYWNLEPVVALAYYSPGGFTLDLKFMYDFNRSNRKAQFTGLNPTGADYRSGQELHLDFAAGYKWDKWQLGVSGYYYRQTTGDRIDDADAQALIDTLGGLKGEAFALGPALHYDAGRFHLIATWQHEFRAVYRPQGNKLWLKFIVPLQRRG